MFKIKIILITLAIAVCSNCFFTACTPATSSEKKLPNVVFILADDIGYGELACYGGQLPTPNLDALAKEGMLFTDAHAPAALCAPSRFSFLTGSYPYRAYSAGGAWNTNSPSIFSDPNNHTNAKRQITVAEIMQNAGYQTAFIGKSHLGGDIRNSNGELIREEKKIFKMDMSKGVHNSINEYGFDYSYSLPSGIQHEPFAFFENGKYAPFDPNKPSNNSSTKLWVNGNYTVGNNGISKIVEHNKQGGIGDEDYNSSQVGIMMINKAINFIDNHLEQNRFKKEEHPFLLYYASQAIHVPHTTPINFSTDSSEIGEKVSGVTGSKTGDFIYELDIQVGKLLQKLKDEGIEDNTIVIFTSDNGALWPRTVDFGESDHDNNGPLRGYKASIYEGGHRVPFIVKWPGIIQQGLVSNEPILGQDWVATMYELTNQNMEEDQAMDCTSLMPLLKNEQPNNEPLHPFIIYQAGFAYEGAIRQNNWVLTVNRDDKPQELYNLNDDLAQKNNLINNKGYKKLVNQLQATFIKYNDHNDKTREPRTTIAFRNNKK